jgi:hypothetical protein
LFNRWLTLSEDLRSSKANYLINSINIVGSSDDIDRGHLGSPGQSAQSMEGVMSEYPRSSETCHDMTEKPISFDFINSINIVGSTGDIESNHKGPSGQFIWDTKWRDTYMKAIETERFTLSVAFEPWHNRAEESTIAQIKVASSLTTLLLITAGIVVLFDCRRR